MNVIWAGLILMGVTNTVLVGLSAKEVAIKHYVGLSFGSFFTAVLIAAIRWLDQTFQKDRTKATTDISLKVKNQRVIESLKVDQTSLMQTQALPTP